MSRGEEAENFPSREPEKRLNLVMHENYMRREKNKTEETFNGSPLPVVAA